MEKSDAAQLVNAHMKREISGRNNDFEDDFETEDDVDDDDSSSDDSNSDSDSDSDSDDDDVSHFDGEIANEDNKESMKNGNYDRDYSTVEGNQKVDSKNENIYKNGRINGYQRSNKREEECDGERSENEDEKRESISILKHWGGMKRSDDMDICTHLEREAILFNSPFRHIYNEFTLQGLLQNISKQAENEDGRFANLRSAQDRLTRIQVNLSTLKKFHSLCVCFSDINNDYKWMDMIMRTSRPASISLDMKRRNQIEKEVKIRMYLYPPHMRNRCVYRIIDSSTLVGGSADRRTNVSRVCEFVHTISFMNILKLMGFRQISAIYVKARIYFSKYNTNNSCVLFLQQFFLDEDFTTEWNDGIYFVEAKARSTDLSAIESTDASLHNWAKNFLPFVYLRRVDQKDIKAALKEKPTE